MVTFLRRTWKRYSKLGRKRKKKQTWRKPTGRDNKMREKRKGYPAVVSVGYKANKSLRGKLQEKNPIMVKSLLDLEKIGKNDIALIGNIGKKKRLEIIQKAKEKKILVHNINIDGFLKKVKEKKKPEKKENKK